jgi:hypothetical protein
MAAHGTRAALPPGIPMLSIAALGDPVVPVGRTTFAGARAVTIGSGGLFQHSGVVGREATSREIGLFLDGRAPACRSLVARVGAVVVPMLIEGIHEMVATAGPTDGYWWN